MEGKGGSLKDGAEAFMLFLHGAQLVLRSNVLTVLDLDEVNVNVGGKHLDCFLESFLQNCCRGMIFMLCLSSNQPLLGSNALTVAILLKSYEALCLLKSRHAPDLN